MSADVQQLRERLQQMIGGFRAACVLGAAAELDVFSVLGDQAMTAGEIAARLRADTRATTMLLDAAAALGLLEKRDERYVVPAEWQTLLVADSPQSYQPMLHHNMNILRAWAQLALVVKQGAPPPRQPGVRGAEADRAAFIAAMHSVSGPMADALVARLGPPAFEHLLDVGGASGTWTLAFLRAAPRAKATIFDLPDAIQQARDRLAQGEFSGRVTLVPGDFYRDDLPAGADLAWVSAIAHQHSRAHNRALFEKTFAALRPGGRILLRDFVMEPGHVRPLDGALFAINMLVNTESGGTFTFEEYAEDLRAAGFLDPQLLLQDGTMNSVVAARKPIAG